MNKLMCLVAVVLLSGCMTTQPMENGDTTPNASVWINYPYSRTLDSIEVWKSRCTMKNGNYGGLMWAILPPAPTYRSTATFIPNGDGLLIVKTHDSVNPLAVCTKDVCGVMTIYRLSPDKEGTRIDVRTKMPNAGNGYLKGAQKVIESGGIAGSCLF